MIRSLVVLVVTILATIALVACQTPANTPVVEPTPTIAVVASETVEVPGIADAIALDDAGAMIGRVLSITDSRPLSNTVVGLAQVTRGEGEKGVYAYNSAQSPTNITDVNGQFLITDIPAGEYVIVVGDVFSRNEVIKDPTTRKAATYFVEVGNVTRVGDLVVDIGQ